MDLKKGQIQFALFKLVFKLFSRIGIVDQVRCPDLNHRNSYH